MHIVTFFILILIIAPYKYSYLLTSFSGMFNTKLINVSQMA